MAMDLVKDARKRQLIAAHRGVQGGNIPGNTIAAFDAALMQGADLLEMDITRSLDGTLYVFHPGMEHVYLKSEKRIDGMYDSEIAEQRFYNVDGTKTQYRVNRLDEVLDHLKGKCYINLDKYWEHVAPIMEVVRRASVMDQIVAKAPFSETVIREVEQFAPDINFMLMLYEKDEWSDWMLKRNLHYVGAEVIFKSDASEFATGKYIKSMHDKGLLVWANAIVYNYKTILAGGHNDDVSLSHSPELGWGWLLDHGYDIIQTDWPLALQMFKSGRG